MNPNPNQRLSAADISSLPEAIFSTADVREFDRKTIEEHGISGFELMSRAGDAAWDALVRQFPDVRSVRVFCGGGNNGGDGYIVAARALAAGCMVEVVTLTDPAQLSGDAATAHKHADDAGVRVVHANAQPGDSNVIDCDVIVDGLFGTGLTRPLEGVFAQTVRTMNRNPAPVVSLDVPSGLDSDFGRVLGAAVRADLTVTFVGLKPGLFLGRAPDHVGRLVFAGLEIPAGVRDGVAPVLTRLDPGILASSFPRRSKMSHKGMNGEVLLVGGAPGMAGAIRLAAEAALRAGAGRVRVATHPDSVSLVMAGRPELMCRAVEDGDGLTAVLGSADAVVLGPGLGLDGWGESLFDAAIGVDQPLVVDADGLNWLARKPRELPGAILTPHPGEAGRLLGTGTVAVQDDRLGAVTDLAGRFSAAVVLKGACSLIAEGHRRFVCDAGNPGMATAGMGDVLAGIAGSLVAQWRSPDGVAAVATLVHALAGDRAAEAGERGLVASDLFGPVRSLVNGT